jgi:hypothetical protein
VCIRKWSCVMVRLGGCRRFEHSGGTGRVMIVGLEWRIKPVYLRQWRCRSTAEECICIHQRVEMCYDQTRRMQVVGPEWRGRGSDHSGVNLYAPDGYGWTRRVQVVSAQWRSLLVYTRQGLHSMVSTGGGGGMVLLGGYKWSEHSRGVHLL